MTTALIRDGEYVRMSGAMATEYAAQVAAVDEPEEDARRGSPDTSPPEPTATRATPTNETRCGEPEARRSGRSRAEREAEERGEDRDRAEDEPDRRRGRQVEREDEGELVEPERERRRAPRTGRCRRSIAERPLDDERQRDEDRRPRAP